MKIEKKLHVTNVQHVTTCHFQNGIKMVQNTVLSSVQIVCTVQHSQTFYKHILAGGW